MKKQGVCIVGQQRRERSGVVLDLVTNKGSVNPNKWGLVLGTERQWISNLGK